jgi:hypothetical protein
MVTAYFSATSRKPGLVRSFCIVTFCLLGSVRAASAVSPVTSPGMLCDQAIVAAEQRLHLPSGILAAVGRAETGRADQAGKAHPWPYTINAEGTGTFFATKQAAVAAIEELQSRGVRSIDVGCVQVNLLHHPAAFASLDQAFDPAANATYGARFLRQLYQEMRSWPAAIAAYHSRTPEIGANYQARVLFQSENGSGRGWQPNRICRFGRFVRSSWPGALR